jgi:hypothetical protein
VKKVLWWHEWFHDDSELVGVSCSIELEVGEVDGLEGVQLVFLERIAEFQDVGVPLRMDLGERRLHQN